MPMSVPLFIDAELFRGFVGFDLVAIPRPGITPEKALEPVVPHPVESLPTSPLRRGGPRSG